MRFSRRILLILVSIGLVASAASAQTVLYNNLSSPIDYYYPIGPIYNSFSTGSTGLVLSDVKLNLEFLDGAPTGFSVGLYADSSATPGTLIQSLGSMSDSAISGNGAVYDFPVSPGVSLAANTRYWIGLTTSNGSNTGWATTDSTSGTGVLGAWTCFDYVLTSATTRPTAKPRGFPVGCFQNTAGSFIMEVTATAPAAATAPALSFSGMLVLTLLLAASAALFLRRSSPVQS